jgi:glucokinase
MTITTLAIDLGGTRLRAACFDDNFQQISRAETLTRSEDPVDAVIARVIATAKEAIAGGQPPQVIGMSTPGPMDAKRGVILHSFALPGWDNVPLTDIVSQAIGVPAYAENDGNVAPIAEYTLGAGRGTNPMMYLTISTGIGGGVIIDGKLFTGWSGHAAEAGHMQFIDENGNVRRLEELASGTAIGRMAAQKVAAWAGDTSLRGQTFIDGKAVGDAAQAGDAFALTIVRQAGRYLGLGIVNLLHLFSPEAIVVGGSVSKLGELIFAPAWDAIHERVLDPAFIPPNLIRPAHFGDDVCLVGAAIYARQRYAKELY